MMFVSTGVYLVAVGVVLLLAVVFVVVATRKKGPSRFDEDIDVAVQEQWRADRKKAQIEEQDNL